MKSLFLSLALFCAAQQVLANQAACLQQPTQECVFELALQQADDERWPWQIAEGYLAVAYLQELEQPGGAEETLAALLVQLASRNPDPAEIKTALESGWTSLMFSRMAVSDQPAMTSWFTTTLAELVLRADLPIEEPPDFLPPGQLAEISIKVAEISGDTLPRYALLNVGRGWEVPRSEMGIFAMPRELTSYHSTILKALFAKGALTGAQAEIAVWPDREQRANGYAVLALAMAKAGEIAQALAVLQAPELSDTDALSYDLKHDLVEVWARAGDASKASMLPEIAGLEPDLSPHLRAAVTAALVTGDAGTAARILGQIELYHQDAFIYMAIDAALVHGPEPVEALLALLPPEGRGGVLHALGKAQIRVGDVEGAASTIDQLTLVQDPYFGKTVARSLRYELAPVLAAIGHDLEAIKIASDLGDAKTTSLVAARLQ